MREIKFRGKSKITGQWCYGYLIIDEITDKYYIFQNGNSCNENNNIGQEGVLYIFTFEVDPNTIGQYTGLHDKNGKEIYEGDIVKADYDKAIIKYSNEDSGFILKPIGEYYFDSSMVAHNINLELEVIGNTIDNLELLESE